MPKVDNKTILLTGATGFLGSHLLEALLEKNYNVLVLKRGSSNTWRINHLVGRFKSYDIDKVPLEKPFKENKIDIVIHTAINYGRTGERISDMVEANLVFPLKLLEVATSFNTNTFFNTDTLLYKYLNPYTLSKNHFAEWLKVFSDKIKVINFRIEHMYGEKDSDNKFVIWLINEFLHEKEEVSLTKGEQKRDFIYISDVVNAYLKILENLEKLNSFNNIDIGTGKFYTIKDFVIKTKEAVEKVSGKKVKTSLNFGAIPYRKGELMEVEEDISMLVALGWNPKTDLSDGLSKVVKHSCEL